jgi:predicted DNA-binding transcriptional regulator YafY
VERAFEKLASVLTPHMRQFLDRLPSVIAAKPDPLRRRPAGDARHDQIVARAFEATLHYRQAMLTYHSKSSDRTKTYLVHPYRLAYAQGGMYLLAYVPEYGEVRTFAAERIEDVSLLEEHFTPIEDLPEQAFPHSLGVHTGPPERIEIEFDPAVADYVRGRQWHQSQAICDREDGSLHLTLDVCRDRTLSSWILSFGPFARVLQPVPLAREIGAQLQEASARYAS